MAFKREKRVKGHVYHCLVENYRQDGRVRQRILQYWGRADESPVTKAYRENIGPVVPILADKIRKAQLRWPEEWILKAITEAVVSSTKPNWKYVVGILEGYQERGGPDTPGKVGSLERPLSKFRSINGGPAPLTVEFEDLSEGSISERSWNFGDGSGWITTASPSHTFLNPGTYHVILEVVGPGGSSESGKDITVRKGGVGNQNARGPRKMTQVTCRVCNRQFNAVITKSGTTNNVCWKCVRK